MHAQAPDGRRLSIARDQDGWILSVQSSPSSEMRVSGRDLERLLSQVTNASPDEPWVRELAARAERELWKPLGWRQR